MVIHKILNNNLILSRDGQGHEVIVKGCGIAFQKKKGQQVEEARIEKIFTAENAQISKEIQGYLTAIPEKYLDFVEAFVNDLPAPFSPISACTDPDCKTKFTPWRTSTP